MQEQNDNIITSSINRAAGLALLPALSVAVLLRHGVGYRMLHPGRLLVLFAVLTLFASSDNNHFFRPLDLFVFACLMLTSGLCQLIIRWWGLQQGEQHHSFYLGTPWMERLKWPNWIRRHRLVRRFIEPFVCAITGFGLYHGTSPMLGAWLMLSGVCLMWMEGICEHRKRHRKLDTMDGLIESGIHSEYVEEFAEPSHQQSTIDAGVPTGMAKDIERKIPGRNKNA